MRWLVLVSVLSACQAPVDELITGLPNLPGGNPLVPEVALYPWPSDLYLAADTSTTTGFRVDVPPAVLPDDSWAPIVAEADGFSRAVPMLAYLPGGFDASSFPTLAESVTPAASVQLWREGADAPTPILVELNSEAPGAARQALVIRPQVSLDPDAAYAVLVTDRARKADGSAHTASDAFRALRDGIPTDSSELEAQRASFSVALDAMAAAELAPEQVVLGWTFRTRSARQTVDVLAAMHQAMLTAPTTAWRPVSQTSNGTNDLIVGRFDVPNFLDADQRIVLDADGLPVAQGTREIEFLLAVPVTVSVARPVIVFGHGFFSDKGEITWGSLQRSLQPWQMSAISINFDGFAEADFVTSAPALAGDVVTLARVVDQQRQSQAQFTALARLVSEQLVTDVSVTRDGADFSPINPANIPYMGISNGGTQGYVIAATSPLLSRAALVVGGGGWSHMTQRATQWNTLGALLENRFPDPLVLQVGLALMQQVFDPVDALNFAPQLVHDRLPGLPPVEVTLHMAVGDAQVSNMTTEWVARAAGIPLVTPSARQVWGLDTIIAANPGNGARTGLIIYDEGYDPLPEGNVAPVNDNGAHETIRDLLSYQTNVGHFLETGEVLQACTGACDPD